MNPLPTDEDVLDSISDCILMNEPMYDGVSVDILSSERSPYYRFNGFITHYKVTLPDGTTHMDYVELNEPIAIGVYKSSTVHAQILDENGALIDVKGRVVDILEDYED